MPIWAQPTQAMLAGLLQITFMFLISYSTHFDYASPPFPLFIGRRWEQRRDVLGLFRIQPRDQPPAGDFSKFIFVVWIFF